MKINDRIFGIFIDIDNTLLGSDKSAVLKNIDTIQLVRSLGHKVFISTGRATGYVPRELEIEKNFDGMISGAGAIINIYGKESIKNLMPYRVTKKFCDFVIKNGLPGVLEGERNLYYFDGVENPACEWIKINEDNLDTVILKDIPIEKFTVMGQISEDMDKMLGEEYTVLRHSYYAEIIRADCGKGTALKKTMELLGLPVNQSIALGDSMNDFDMIETAGIGVAMENADERIKAIADFITCNVDDAGVSAALYKLLDIK